MQVTSLPSVTGIASQGSPQAAVQAKDPARPAIPASGEVAVHSFQRALVEAAGLKAHQAAKVQVVLSVDEGSNRVIAKMYNKESGELIHQMPTDQMLRNSAMIREMLGAAVDAFA